MKENISGGPGSRLFCREHGRHGADEGMKAFVYLVAGCTVCSLVQFLFF